MKEHIIKLMPGDDLYYGIDRYCRMAFLTSGYIATCIGSLTHASFRKGFNKDYRKFEGPFEIVSCVGTVSKSGHHIHMSVSDPDFSVIGGHITPGTIVQSRAVVVIIEFEEHVLHQSKDALSDHKELTIERIACCEHDET